MQLKQLFTDEEAVSPVIGVIPMVAVTVILAAVIGTLVLGIGQDQQTTPSASWDFEWDSSNTDLTVTHAGGDNFNSENSNRLTLTNGSDDTNSATYCWGSCSGLASGSTYGTGSFPVSAGDTVTVGQSAGDTVRVIWQAPGGGKTKQVDTFDIPS